MEATVSNTNLAPESFTTDGILDVDAYRHAYCQAFTRSPLGRAVIVCIAGIMFQGIYILAGGIIPALGSMITRDGFARDIFLINFSFVIVFFPCIYFALKQCPFPEILRQRPTRDLIRRDFPTSYLCIMLAGFSLFIGPKQNIAAAPDIRAYITNGLFETRLYFRARFRSYIGTWIGRIACFAYFMAWLDLPFPRSSDLNSMGRRSLIVGLVLTLIWYARNPPPKNVPKILYQALIRWFVAFIKSIYGIGAILCYSVIGCILFIPLRPSLVTDFLVVIACVAGLTGLMCIQMFSTKNPQFGFVEVPEDSLSGTTQ